MSQELAPWNILVNALCVGVIKSGQWERRHAQQAPDTDYDAFLKPQAARVPLGRVGEAEVFANVACFLASDAAGVTRSEEHTSELQSLMRISYAVFCLKKKKHEITHRTSLRIQTTQNHTHAHNIA